MWWCWQTAVLMATTVVTAQQSDSADDSDYIDEVYEDEPMNSPASVSDILSQQSGATKIIQGAVEQLLGQPVIQYEEPDNSLEGGQAQTRSRLRSSFEPPWNELTEGIGLRGFKAMKSKPGGRGGRRRTEEVVYSVRVPQWDDGARIKQKARPGVIESLVNAHEVTRDETPRPHAEGYLPPRSYGDPARMPVYSRRMHGYPTRTYGANQTAYNEGGFRYRISKTFEDYQNVLRQYPSGRRNLGLLTVPDVRLTATTRQPSTPVTMKRLTVHKFSRKTKRHPNCTDSYYECLLKCFDKRGYRVKCSWDTTIWKPARLNFTRLFQEVLNQTYLTQYDFSNIFWSWTDRMIKEGYGDCLNFTTKAASNATKEYPIYYDELLSNKTGTIMAKCWVCGLLDHGIPHDSFCSDNFRDIGTSMALAEKNSYRRYCRYMDEVPLWYNRSDPLSVYGPWTGGCSWRWLDVTGLYTQRACRSLTVPATGLHYLSKRMAQLELSLNDVKEGCIVSPIATLVPFSRAVSLYARIHVCVCRGQFCNQATRKEQSLVVMMIVCAMRGLQLINTVS